jgi:hypothetical protein
MYIYIHTGGFDPPAQGDFHFEMKVAMWALELGLVD